MEQQPRIINIILNESLHAKEFDQEKSLIHKTEFDKVINLIRESIPVKESSQGVKFLHNTITISGTRGSGKTSFLLSIREGISNNKMEYTDGKRLADVQALNIIDPTLIEEKGHVFLNIISLIVEKIEDQLDIQECNPGYKDKGYRRKEWRDALHSLANGLPSIDGVGNSSVDNWQDAEFVMDNGLKAVTAARKLADSFDSFLKLSLDIIEKKVFLLIFDDIDINASKGWAVLETIRKYLTSTRLIILLSGDLKLYSLVVRQKKWGHFSREILKYEGVQLGRLEKFNDTVTDLESQYLLKIMQPRMRVHLTTLLEKTKLDKSLKLLVYGKEVVKDDIADISDRYKDIFLNYGIRNNTQEDVFRSFMMGQPLRTQIQFLVLMASSTKNKRDEVGIGYNDEISNENITDIFLSDLLEKDVDVISINNYSKFINAIIIKLLIEEKRLNDSYQLQPITPDRSLNACLFTLNIILSKYIKEENLFLCFEYFIKVGFLRNILSIVSYRNNKTDNNGLSDPSIEDLIDRAGIYNDGVLRDISSCIEAYLLGYYETLGPQRNNTFSFIQLLGLKSQAKRNYDNRIDIVFSKPVAVSQKILGYMPCFAGVYSYKNESRIGYSLYVLLGAIGEIVKNYETVLIYRNEEELKTGIIDILIELSQLRSYPIPGFKKLDNEVFMSPSSDDQTKTSSSTKNDEGGASEDQDAVLANKIYNWIINGEGKINVASHLLGKISTRLFYALNNIDERVPKDMQLGDLFHHQIIAFLNAVVIEDVKENLTNFSILNINNTNFSDKIFITNIRKVSGLKDFQEKKDLLRFSRWLLACPLLMGYLDTNSDSLKQMLINYCGDLLDKSVFDLSVHKLLNQVATRESGGTEDSVELGDSQKLSPSLLHMPDELAKILRDRGVPYEWFTIGNLVETRARNKRIVALYPEVFNYDNWASKRIRDFRVLLKKRGIRW